MRFGAVRAGECRHGGARPLQLRAARGYGALGFTYYTVGLSLVITVLVNRTGGRVAMAILLHWSSNLIPHPPREMFPDVRQEGPDYVVIGRVALTVVAAVVVAAAGRSFFRPPVVSGETSR